MKKIKKVKTIEEYILNKIGLKQYLQQDGKRRRF